MNRRMKANTYWIVLLIWNATLTWAANGVLGGGTGDPNNPYLIEDFNDFGVFCADPNYWAEGLVTFLMTDLDLDPNLPGRQVYNEAPFGRIKYLRYDQIGAPFAGTFQGNGHEIRNFTFISESDDHPGLVGVIDCNATISSLSLEGIRVDGDEDVGGLCSINKGRIQGCHVVGTVKGKWTIGGICSDNQGGTLVDCEVDIRAYASEDVAGGICGYNHEGTLRGCQAHVLVCSPINAGGLCGFNSGRIEACWVKGEVVSVSWGDDEPAASPSYYLGGLCGSNGGHISYCGAVVDVNGGDYVGGICGSYGGDESLISYCYARGKIIASGDCVGGICGYVDGDGVRISDCLWDVTTSGQIEAVVVDDSDEVQLWNLIGRTSTQMLMSRTYLDAGWDLAGESAHGTCDRWAMTEGQTPLPVQLDPNFTPHAYQGAGTEADPYRIFDANDLGAMWQQPEACYALAGDIDLQDIVWYSPLVESFGGRLDGQGYTLSHLLIEGYSKLGLFSRIEEGGRVADIVIEQASISGQGDYIGTLCGINEGTLSQCVAHTSVIGQDYIGGLCGYNASTGSLIELETSGAVVGRDYVGGICGMSRSICTDCNSKCSVAGREDVGQTLGAYSAGR